MNEKIEHLLIRGREFDEIVEEIFAIAENEKNKAIRDEEIRSRFEQIKRAYMGAHYDAITDSLTGCFNKKHIKEMFHHQYASTKRNKQFFSLAVADIDYLKYINDTFGHNIGDEVIKNIAEAIKKSIRESDLVFRYGGDEFVILCSHNKKNGMKTVASRIKEEVSNLKKIKNFKPAVTIGYKSCDTQGDAKVSYKELFKIADEILYTEKHNRKPPKFLTQKR